MTALSARSRMGLSVLVLLWLLLLAPILFLASVPTSVTIQGLLSLVTLGLLIVLKPFVQISLPTRFAMLAVASFFTLRYWLWRLTDTLPSPDEPVSFVAAVVLFGAETFTVVLFFLTALVTADPTDPKPPARVRLKDVPRVDILVPSYNEPPELLAVTLAAAKQINYPADKMTVVLCDDGGTDQRCNHTNPEIARESQARRVRLQQLCRDLDVVYVTRARNESAKAGNLNAALKNLTGELFLVLDADHVPSRDFLARTVGYFVENPRLFLVQTPHFFINRDPIERNLGLPETCPSENEMFYSTIHRGLDRLGGAFFCGSAALLRRRAVDEVGGISGETITEDAETALDIHARGWESKYLDQAMIGGLQPETFASFIQQRGRWATGMIQMLLLKNPIFRSGLSLTQRLCYLNSMSFWLFPLIRMIFLISPLFYIFFGLEIFVVSSPEVLVYILPYLLIGFLVQNALFANVRWPQISEVYEIAQTPYLLRAILGTVLRPRAASFKVTVKEDELDHAFLSPIFVPLLALVVLMGVGLIVGGYRWIAFPGDRTVVQIVGAWNLYNFLLCAFALRSVFERPVRPEQPRTGVSVGATLNLTGDGKMPTALPATIIAAGAKSITLRFENEVRDADGKTALHKITEGSIADLIPVLPNAPELERALAVTITAVHSGVGGMTVTLDVAPEDMIAASRLTAFVTYGDSARWIYFRKVLSKRRGLVSGLLFVFRKSILSLPVSVIDFLNEPARRKALAAPAGAPVLIPDPAAGVTVLPTAPPDDADDPDEEEYLEVGGNAR
ncbi:UDP-forming cellulose synthase catalytic subunit [Oceaniglobus ichthyenteri]|uniref:UDP-forming cellulose synthase catalytic subunit n=1 Tax=Oceaniglobus ichthyenteri TaxID=2136177 RepID=UPI001F0C2D01|nr:UDP-forming cellulose synthase catalytic subunit [Oceaniglobus ichthyenteri]